MIHVLLPFCLVKQVSVRAGQVCNSKSAFDERRFAALRNVITAIFARALYRRRIVVGEMIITRSLSLDIFAIFS